MQATRRIEDASDFGSIMKILMNFLVLLSCGSSIVLLYICFVYNIYQPGLVMTQTQSKFVFRHYGAELPAITRKFSICTNSLERMTKGRWKKKTHVAITDEVSRDRLGVEIRERRGFPLNLTRDDLHCGPKYPLPKGNEVKLDIPAGCDHMGLDPCCNPDIGKCGRDATSCSCETCTDFSQLIHAQFADWLPHDNDCKVKHFTQGEACELLSTHVSALTFVGDSLVRHFHCAMMILLTGDEERGALKEGITEEEGRLCEGEWQFVDAGTGMCPLKIARRNSEVEKRKFCFGTSTFYYHFNESYSVTYANMALAAVTDLLGKNNSIVILGIGVHDKYNASYVIEHYLDPIVRLVKNRGRGWPSLIWLGAHSNGFHKPLKYIEHQGMHKIIPYNKMMKRYCEEFGIPFFDSLHLTTGVHSYDGTHYEKAVNILKAQLLLNHLAEKSEL